MGPDSRQGGSNLGHAIFFFNFYFNFGFFLKWRLRKISKSHRQKRASPDMREHTLMTFLPEWHVQAGGGIPALSRILFLLAPRPKSRRQHINEGWAWFEARPGVRLEPGPSRARYLPRDMLLLTTTARERGLVLERFRAGHFTCKNTD